MSAALQHVLDRIRQKTGRHVVESGNGYKTSCPAHEDQEPSLSVALGNDGRVLLNCHAGCSVEQIVASIGLQLRDLMPNVQPPASPLIQNQPSKPKSRIIAAFPYCDEKGALVYQVVKFEPKDFRQRKPRSGGGWDWSVRGCRTLIYNLPAIVKEPERPVVVVEGEKDVESLRAIGVLATCNAGGAGKWNEQHASFLAGRSVVVIPDNDAAGREHAQRVVDSLRGVASRIAILTLPGLSEKEDVSDWIQKGGTKHHLIQLLENAEIIDLMAEAEWPEFIPFGQTDVPEFPVHALPEPLRSWVAATSLATQTPPDLPALLSLSVCGAAIAKRVTVLVRKSWSEPVNLFTAVILEPGNRKSAVFTSATAPLKAIENELLVEFEPKYTEQLANRRLNESRLKKLNDKFASSGKEEARMEAIDFAKRMEEEVVEQEPRLIVDDATSEKLGIMLQSQGGRLASMSPEGGVFDLMKGLYRAGIASFDVYLKGHCGDDLIIDRISRPTIRVFKPALTCCYAIQPEVVCGLGDNKSFRGRGLVARFLFAKPESWIGRREIAPEPVPDEVKDRYDDLVRKLFASPTNVFLELDEAARLIGLDFEEEVESTLREDGSLAGYQDWGAKLAGAMYRIAAILHCVEFGSAGAIGESTILTAIEIARYAIPHAQAAIDLMDAEDEPDVLNAKHIFRWIKRNDIREFSVRDVHQALKRRFKKVDQTTEPLKILVARGIVREKPVQEMPPKPGRPPSPKYQVNPKVFEKEPGQAKNDSCSDPGIENFENSLGDNALPEGGLDV